MRFKEGIFMLKKVNKLLVFLSLISIPFYNINAYEFYDEKNSSGVYEYIEDVYDRVEMYEFLAGSDEEETVEKDYIQATPNDSYWWPVGSAEVIEKNGKLFASGQPASTRITSDFDSDESFRRSKHKGLDIGSTGNGVNYDNVIASKSGVVVYPVEESQKNFSDNGYYGNPDGGTYGNYVMIQHSDGNYTLYAHLAKGSITVMSGDKVEQGQVIGKIGNSGSSTGLHLHFEVRTSNLPDSKTNPLNYVSAENPRPMGVSAEGFSLTTTTLSKEEFVSLMNDYCERTGHESFCNNFAKNAEMVYDASLKNNVNPELVVVTAGTEGSFKPCGNSNNYWGIGISNGESCADGAQYSSLEEGIAGYANTLAAYMPGGSLSDWIEEKYYERLEQGADPNGIGLPGTFAGMQMVYSSLGKHEYGGSGIGGYYYMDPDRTNGRITEIYSTHQEFLDKCYNVDGEHAEGEPVTAWEQSRYTIYQMKGKMKFRQNIFGL